MSELYLVLRSRLDGVVDWVYLDGKIVSEARARLGLGRETLGARLHVSAKTLERYEKRSRFPRTLIPALARELGLRIEQPAHQPVSITVPPEPDRLVRVLEEVSEKLDRLLVLLEDRVSATADQG